MMPFVRTALVLALLPQVGCNSAEAAKKEEYERLANELRPPMERVASKSAEYHGTLDQLKSATQPDRKGPGPFELLRTAMTQCMEVESDLKALKIDPGRFEDPVLKKLLTELDASVDDYVRGRSVCDRVGGMECVQACQGGWMRTNGVLVGVRDEFGKAGIQLPDVGTGAEG